MRKFKFDDVTAAEISAPEPVSAPPVESKPKKQRMAPVPTVPMQPDGEPLKAGESQSVFKMLELLMRQQQNLWEKVQAIELIVTAQWGSRNVKPEATKKAEPHPEVDTNGHPKLANGMVAAWAEVPSADALLKAAEAFVAKHGKKAYRALLEEFKAKQLAEVAKDEDQAKLMARLQG